MALEPANTHDETRSIPAEFWRERYQQQNTPWDLGTHHPVFEALLHFNPDLVFPGPVAVIGAGRGHDAAYFAEKGYSVTAFDIAPEAVAEANALYGNRYGERFKAVEADLFNLPAQYHQQFLNVVEHTCFCAIHPDQRPAYVAAVKTLLKPFGYFIGVIWQHSEWGGPPYSTTEADFRALFGNDFLGCYWAKTQSPPSRQAMATEGVEYLVVQQRV